MAKGKENKEELNGYSLRQRLRKARRKYPFNSTEQALYQELIDLCNEDDWAIIFQCGNEDLCGWLRITDKTLCKARQTLIQQGLIYYKSGKSKRAHSSYSFIKPFTTTVKTPPVKPPTTVNIPGDVTPNVTGDVTPNPPPNATDYNKEQTETQTEVENNPAADAPDGSEDQQEEKPPSLYTACITIYDSFIQSRTEMGAKIDGRQGTAMKNIIAYLTAQAKAKQPNRPPAEVAVRVKEVWSGILGNWHLLSNWQQGRLQLSDINSELTNILTAIKNGTNGKAGIAAGNGKTGTGNQAGALRNRGASIDELQALKRNRGSDGEERTEFTDAEVVK